MKLFDTRKKVMAWIAGVTAAIGLTGYIEREPIGKWGARQIPVDETKVHRPPDLNLPKVNSGETVTEDKLLESVEKFVQSSLSYIGKLDSKTLINLYGNKDNMKPINDKDKLVIVIREDGKPDRTVLDFTHNREQVERVLRKVLLKALPNDEAIKRSVYGAYKDAMPPLYADLYAKGGFVRNFLPPDEGKLAIEFQEVRDAMHLAMIERVGDRRKELELEANEGKPSVAEDIRRKSTDNLRDRNPKDNAVGGSPSR